MRAERDNHPVQAYITCKTPVFHRHSGRSRFYRHGVIGDGRFLTQCPFFGGFIPICVNCIRSLWGYLLTKVLLLYTLCPMEVICTQSRASTTYSAAERKKLYRRLAAGELQRVMPGAMVNADAILTAEQVMSLIHSRQPAAVMNLISALSYHKMTTQIPDALSVALPRGIRMPSVYALPIQVWYTSPALLCDCTVEGKSEYGSFLVTTPERTLVDCFKYRNKIGLSIFLEAARMGRDKLNLSRLHFEAERLRVLNNIRPYLKSFFSSSSCSESIS